MQVEFSGLSQTACGFNSRYPYCPGMLLRCVHGSSGGDGRRIIMCQGSKITGRRPRAFQHYVIGLRAYYQPAVPLESSWETLTRFGGCIHTVPYRAPSKDQQVNLLLFVSSQRLLSLLTATARNDRLLSEPTLTCPFAKHGK